MQILFAVFDSKAGAFLDPFFAKTDEVAQRTVINAGIDPQSLFHRFAGDFTLFSVAVFDPSTGLIKPYEAPVNLGTVLQLTAQERTTQNDDAS